MLGLLALVLLAVTPLLLWPREKPLRIGRDPLPPREDAVVQPLALPGDDYRFQDHSGPIPFEYEPPIPAHEMAELLKPYTKFGHYVTDRRTGPRSPDPGFSEKTESLSFLYWKGFERYNIEQLRPIVMTALREEFRGKIAEADGNEKQFGRLLPTAFSVDPPTGLALAQMQYRLAGPDAQALGKAVDQLVGAAWLAGEHELLRAMLQEGVRWRDATGTTLWRPQLEAIFDPANSDPPGLAFRLHVARGEINKARAELESMPPEARPDHAESWLQRRENGVAAGLDEKARQAIADRFLEASRQFEGFNKPTTERFNGWSDQRVLGWIDYCAAIFGRASDPVADALCYLVEQRDFEGGEMDPSIALQVGFRLRDRGEVLRATPYFTLTQTLAYPPYPPGRKELDAMQVFAGFESALYAAMESAPYIYKLSDADQETLQRAILEMIEYSRRHCTDPASAGIAGRPRYHPLLIKKTWDIKRRLDGREALIPELRKMIANPPTIGHRKMARIYLADLLHHLGRNAEAKEVWRELALGRDFSRSIPLGIAEIARLGRKEHKPEWIDQAERIAHRVLNAIDSGEYAGENTDRTIAIAKFIRTSTLLHIRQCRAAIQHHLDTQRKDNDHHARP